jgi:hypothetical protein
VILVSFWIKVAIKRTIALFKTSPVLICWVMIIIGAFIYAFVNKHITIMLDTRILFLIIPFLILSSLFSSLRTYNVIPVLIGYSKSKFTNKKLYTRFFIKKAFLNNKLLIIFDLFSCYSIIRFATMKKEYIAVLFGTTMFSIILSFILMNIKNNYMCNRVIEVNIRKLSINPVIKSTLYDYLTPNFLTTAVLCTVLLLIVFNESTRNFDFLSETRTQYLFFIISVIIFSIGFSGIVESIPHMNWKFQSIISPNDFTYHTKRTMLFLCGVYGWLLIPFIVFGSFINLPLMLKYLYCLSILLLATIFTAFTISNMLIKLITFVLGATLTIWVSTLQTGFLSVLVIPVIIAFVKAKNEYKEWSLL